MNSFGAMRTLLHPLCVTAALAVSPLPALPESPAQGNARGFYYWKTALDWSGTDAAFARETGATRLYVRLFDVDMDGSQAVPRAPLRIVRRPGLEIVPVVFIRPYVVNRLSQNDLRSLAGQITGKARSMTGPFNELQIDCDWTPSTRENFFFLLKEIRQSMPANATLSATIRLHQLKFRERTGIPPVDRGALMVYGLSPPSSPDTGNSILDLREARSYLHGEVPYSLPLDAALPVYSSAVLFHNGRFRRLLGEIETLPGAGFSRRGNQFCAQHALDWQGAKLVEGDCIRVEIADPKLAMQLRDLVLPLMKGDSRVILFHYSSGLTRHGTTDIRSLFDAFRTSPP